MLTVLSLERNTTMKPYHEMTKAEIGDTLRKLYYAQPKADWDKLAVGNVLLQKGRGWRITRIPPKRGFVLATNIMTSETEKLLRSQYATSDLLVTNEAVLAKLQTSHLDEINKAIAKGISISPLVQYDYPEVFTPYPAEWDEKRRDKAHDLWRRINEMRAFNDLRDAPGWQLRKVDDFKAQTVKDIADYKKYRAEVEAGVGIKKPEVIPEIVARIDENISDSEGQIEMLDHLRKHLEKTLDSRPSGR